MRTRLLALIAAVALLPHLPGLLGNFVYDDFRFVSENPGVHTLEQPYELVANVERMTAQPDRDIWRPLRTLGFALQHALFQNQPAGYHALSLLGFFGTVLALLCLARGLGLRTPLSLWIVGLSFGWHPLTVESVAWISSQGDLQAAALVCLTLALSGTRPWLALLTAALALLAKESAAPLVLALFAARLWMEKRQRPTLRLIGSVLLLTVAYLVVRQNVLDRDLSAGGQGFAQIDAPLSERLLVFSQNLPLLLRLYLAPWHLSVDYGDGYPRAPGALDVVLTVVLLMVAGWVWWRGRPRPPVRFAITFTLLFFLLTSGLLFAMRSPTAERFHLLPAAGLSLLTAALLRSPRPMLLRVSVLVWLLFLGTRTAVRTLDWCNQETLFQAELALHPESVEAHLAIGVVHGEAGQTRQAEEHYRRVLELTSPGDIRQIKILFLLAAMRIEAGDRRSAVPLLESCRQQMLASQQLPEPESELSQTWSVLGNLYLTQIGPEAARPVLEEGRRLLGERSDLLTELAFLHLKEGHPERALPLYRAALAAGGRGARLYTQLGDTLLRLDQVAEGHQWLRQALDLDPDFGPAHRLLGQ